MPRSSASLMNGVASASPITQLRHSGEPKVIVPRQILETLRPVEPRLTNFMLTAPARAMCYEVSPDPTIFNAIIRRSRTPDPPGTDRGYLGRSGARPGCRPHHDREQWAQPC